MMVNDGFKGGRNDDHENVDRNCETSQKLLISSFALLVQSFSWSQLSWNKILKKKNWRRIRKLYVEIVLACHVLSSNVFNDSVLCCFSYVSFLIVLFSEFRVCPNIGKLSNFVCKGNWKPDFFFQFDKKAMIVKFEELDDERQKEAKLVRL